MKRSIIFPFLMFLLLYCSSHSQPKIEVVGGDTYDWGSVRPKENFIQAKVKIKNSGNALLKIIEVKPSCGCTTAPLDKNDIPPDSMATLDITIRINPGQTGGISKQITLRSNDSLNATKVLMLKADIIRDIIISPAMSFYITDLKVGNESKNSLKIKNNSQSPFTISDFDITPKTTTINLNGKIEVKPGQEVELIAKTKPTQKGAYNCEIKMKTTNQETPNITLTGYGNVAESPIFNN